MIKIRVEKVEGEGGISSSIPERVVTASKVYLLGVGHSLRIELEDGRGFITSSVFDVALVQNQVFVLTKNSTYIIGEKLSG